MYSQKNNGKLVSLDFLLCKQHNCMGESSFFSDPNKKKRLEEKFAIVKDPRSASPSTSYKTRNWPKEGIVSSEDLLAAVGGK